MFIRVTYLSNIEPCKVRLNSNSSVTGWKNDSDVFVVGTLYDAVLDYQAKSGNGWSS